MPWKGEKNPYKIWLSEVILQQTRVAQGLNYYNRFITQYPTVHHLAEAPQNEVFKLWEGLGYYNRCRNLMETARYISKELNGIFPNNYDDIVKLKGIGPYTAAAISSFAFNLPFAVVDGNVNRVLSRFFGDATPIDSTEGKKHFQQLADKLLPENSASFNQAIMDFGATICTPLSPQCNICPLSINCVAFKRDMVNILPLKLKEKKVKNRHFNYLFLRYRQQFLIKQRAGKDIWEDLWEFPLVETETATEFKNVTDQFHAIGINVRDNFSPIPIELSQQLTHRKIIAKIYTVRINNKQQVDGYHWINCSATNQFAFPRLLRKFLDQNCNQP